MVGGTGTAGRAAMWATGGANVATSNLDIDGLSSVLTLLTSATATITFPATGTVALLGQANSFSTTNNFAAGVNIGSASGAGVGEIAASGLIDAAGGFYVSGTKIIGARRTGWGGPTGTATRTTFATGTVTLVQLAERFKALIDDLSTHGLIGG
jgi:3-phosphoglycerate kinase